MRSADAQSGGAGPIPRRATPREEFRMRLMIEIDTHSRPIAGWLQPDGEPRREFAGMLELISLLEELRERPPEQPVELAPPEPN